MGTSSQVRRVHLRCPPDSATQWTRLAGHRGRVGSRKVSPGSRRPDVHTLQDPGSRLVFCGRGARGSIICQWCCPVVALDIDSSTRRCRRAWALELFDQAALGPMIPCRRTYCDPPLISPLCLVRSHDPIPQLKTANSPLLDRQRGEASRVTTGYPSARSGPAQGCTVTSSACMSSLSPVSLSPGSPIIRRSMFALTVSSDL
ncbi:hypothetical protein C8Q80DRAFT_336979 [Daedaleopsis nitida]|nr:hypothetical protein C8Q80DRAFT_336979 [Daedaleopsis nitida]